MSKISLFSLLSSRELSATTLPLRSAYPEITIHSLDLSSYFGFPGARELIHIAVAPSQVLDDQVYDKIDERISAYGFQDRPKIVEFTRIEPEVLELLGTMRSVALLDRADLETLGNQSLARFLRKLFVRSFSLRVLNPYVYRGPVTGRQFFGREDEIASLRSQSQRSFIISGSRRCGKSSLLIETKRRLDLSPQSEEIVIYITFENCTSISDLPREVLRALPGKSGDYINLANSRRWVFPQNLHLLGGPLFSYLHACRKEARVVRFFLDEYDRVLNLERRLESGLTGLFRELLVKQKIENDRRSAQPLQVQFAFAGSPLLHEELLSKPSPLYNFATKLSLRNFDLSSLTRLITLPLRDLGIEVADPALTAQAMLEITGGHPSSSQHLCSILVERSQLYETAKIGLEQVRKAGSDPEFIGEFEETIARNISPLGRFILALVAKSTRHLFDAHFLLRNSGAYGILLDRAAVMLELAGLADSGYLRATGSAQGVAYTLAIPTVKEVYYRFDPKELVPQMLAENQCALKPAL